jgi:YD repeat-containing protein
MVVRLSELDAEQRLTTYGYDGNGNRTRESIETADLGLVEKLWAWDGTFNKPTLKQDAEGHATTWVVVAPKGDATSMTDAQGNETTYEYQDGMLTRETDARQNATEYSEHNAYGQWQRKTDALGNVTVRDYDARGRLVHESDSFGRDLVQEWDALDRVVKMTRRAGGESADEVTERRYYPKGELAWTA